MSEPVRVAQIIGRVAEGGVERMIANLFEHIDRTKYLFDFYVENTSIIVDREKIENLGGRVFIVPPYKKLSKFKKFLKIKFLENKYKIVHVNMNSLSFIALKVAKKCGVEIRICHSHSTTNKKEGLKHILKLLLKPWSKLYATNLLACSTLAGEWLYGKKSNFEIINNAIDLERFSYNKAIRNELRNKLNLKDNDFVIGNVGRFCVQKNQKFLIQLFKYLVVDHPNYHLLLIGTGEHYDLIKKNVIYDNIQNVHLIGAVPNVFEYYNVMDCFVLPSLYEGLPVVGVEAQVNGLKCYFSTNITREAKLNESTEFISLKGGIDSWMNKIVSFEKIKTIRLTTSNLENYDINVSSRKLACLYTKFLLNMGRN